MSSFEALSETFDAYDAGGNAGLSRFGFAGALAIPDASPASLTVLSPPADTPINPDAPLSVRIVSTAPVIVYASLASHRATEVVFAAGELLAPYDALSEVVSVPGGWELTIRRRGGWPGTVTLHTRALGASDA